MNIVHWNDDRLDGFAKDYRATDEKVDHMAIEVTEIKSDVRTLKAARDASLSLNQYRWMLLATLFSNPITAGVVYLLSKGK